MWWNKKTPDEIKSVRVEVELKPESITKSVIVALVLVNNRTDKPYVIRSENDFGLKWEYIGKANSNFCVINQRMSDSEQGWHAVGRFSNFSIVNIEWKTVTYLRGIPVSEK